MGLHCGELLSSFRRCLLQTVCAFCRVASAAYRSLEYGLRQGHGMMFEHNYTDQVPLITAHTGLAAIAVSFTNLGQFPFGHEVSLASMTSCLTTSSLGRMKGWSHRSQGVATCANASALLFRLVRLRNVVLLKQLLTLPLSTLNWSLFGVFDVGSRALIERCLHLSIQTNRIPAFVLISCDSLPRHLVVEIVRRFRSLMVTSRSFQKDHMVNVNPNDDLHFRISKATFT
jgi:hypothetical protein